MTYANGATVSYTYDKLGRISRTEYSNGRRVEYTYNSNGQLYSATDNFNGTTYYVYDSLGRLICFETEDGSRLQYTYDNNNRLTETDYYVDGWGAFLETFTYNQNATDAISDGTLTAMQMITGKSVIRTLDYLQRLTRRTTADVLLEDYYYTAGDTANTTTTQVSGKKNTLDGVVISNVEYSYDGNGNIIHEVDAVSGATVGYAYDSLNQLTDVVYDNGGTEHYTYDPAGNLLTFDNGDSSHVYTYADADWHDLLTAVDGVTITYDAIGNPLSYYNGSSYDLSWREGRRLVSLITDEGTTAYYYNAEGLRIQKTNTDGTVIMYVIADGTIIGEKHYTPSRVLFKHIRYIFDENGTVCGYSSSEDGTTWTDYYFIRNLQGDVLQVFRASDNAIVASYSYDAWGNILGATGEKAGENPFRYRGYYFDQESGFYYLSSRYYDPAIGRFINADNVIAGVGEMF